MILNHGCGTAGPAGPAVLRSKAVSVALVGSSGRGVGGARVACDGHRQAIEESSGSAPTCSLSLPKIPIFHLSC
jgi:hypothetical protein